MYLFGLEGSGFVISLGLLLLISGAIMFYCLKRFAMIETSILEQGRILHSFINRIQEQENNFAQSNQPNSNNGINKQQPFVNNINNNNNTDNNINKIEVSDNDSSSAYDSDSSDDSDDSNDGKNFIEELNNDNDIKLELVENNNIISDLNNDSTVKIISIEDIEPPELLNTSNALNINQYDSDSNSSTNLDTNSITDEHELDVLNIEEHVVNEVVSEVNNEIKKGGITKMKVSELRELVLQNGLLDNTEDINKIKKENLIKMLQEN